MRLLRNYILRECVLPFFLALGVLSCVFLLGYTVKLAHLVINKGVPLVVVGKMFLLLIPVLLQYTMPIACLIAVLLAFSRLSADNEIIAIRASGIHIQRLLLPLIAVGFIFSLVAFLLNDRVIPFAYHQQKVLEKTMGFENPTALLEPGTFIKTFKGQTIFIHRVEGHKFYNITIWQPQPDGRPTRTIIANRGEFTKSPDGKQLILKLIDGTSDEMDPKKPENFYKLNFKTLFITLNVGNGDEKIEKKPKSMTLQELLEEKHLREQLLVDTSRLDTEYFRKLSWSFAPLIFVLLGFPLAVITNRRERSANVILAIIAASTYYLLALTCEALSIEQQAPAYIIMWVPNVIALIVAVYFNHKLCVS